jgi:hypothetical protein
VAPPLIIPFAESLHVFRVDQVVAVFGLGHLAAMAATADVWSFNWSLGLFPQCIEELSPVRVVALANACNDIAWNDVVSGHLVALTATLAGIGVGCSGGVDPCPASSPIG